MKTKFQRTQGMKELPEPKLSDRTLKELLGRLINVNDTDLSLIICWLLIAFNPCLNCPILFLNARKGQGKSTTTKFIKSIIDPDAAEALSPFDTGKDFNVVAVSRYVLPLDNMGEIAEKFSNQLCRAVTGAGISNRKLFTDYEYIDKKIKSHIIINGIDCIPARSDLRDRCYFVSMQKLDAQHRKLDSELKLEFKDTQAEILGVLLTALHGGLISNHEPKFDFDVRMLDAATFACKCINADKENILQISEDDFKRALASMKIETDEKEIQEDELTEVLYEMAISEYEAAREHDPKITEITLWDGTTKELLKKIQNFACDTFGNAKVKKLPENTRKLGKKIGAKSQLRPILEQTGFSFEQHREGGTGDEGWIIKFNQKQHSGEQNNQDHNDVNENHNYVDEKKTSLIINPSDVEEFSESSAKLLNLNYCKGLTPTTIPDVYGINPNNSEPLSALINLFPQEMAQAVMSNYFIVPCVTINTIIWKYWDLFSMRKYIWTVVRSRQDCVKMFLPDGRCFLCRPHDKEKNTYIADFLSKWGKKRTLFTGSLEDALNACENEIENEGGTRTSDTFIYLIQNRAYIPADTDLAYSHLQKMGIGADYIGATNEITNKMQVKTTNNNYTSALHSQLTEDAEPYSETALYKLKCIKKYELYDSKNIDLLSDKEVSIVYKATYTASKPGRKKINNNLVIKQKILI